MSTGGADRIAIIDVETTGLSPWRHDRIVEIAIVVMSRSGDVEHEYDTLVNPMRDIGPTSIHGITPTAVKDAPRFSDIAGDVADVLRGCTLVGGHNISFDRSFLVSEFRRLDTELPEFPVVCTCRHFGRASLQACCREYGIRLQGQPHRALTDARATAELLSILLSEQSRLIEDCRIRNLRWPQLPVLRTACVNRDLVAVAEQAPPRFLQRIAERLHYDTEEQFPNLLAYQVLLERILEDRLIDANEEDTLVQAAVEWNLSAAQLQTAHQQFLQQLAVAALADGVVTDTERRDLHHVARLLGEDTTRLDTLLQTALAQFARVRQIQKATDRPAELTGQKVCFTGELFATIQGQPVNRNMAEALATEAGLTICGNVTKKLDLLVVADPNTQSGKAKKARDYGVRILPEAVFWQLTGIPVD